MTHAGPEFTRAIARRAGSGALELSARYGVGFLLNVAGLTVAARVLGDAAFGTRFALPLLLVNLFQLLGLGVWATIVQRSEEPDRALLETGFTLQLALALTAALLVASVVSTACARQFGDPAAALACRAAALGGVWTCLRSYGIAVAERHLRYRTVGAAELLDLAVFNAIVIAGGLGGSAHGAVLVAFATRGLPAALYLVYRERPALGLHLDPTAVAHYRSFGLPFLGFSLLQMLPIHAAPTVAAFTLPATLAAAMLSVLGLAYRLLEFPRVLMTIGYRLNVSVQSRLAHDADAFGVALRTGLRVLLALLAPALGALALFAPLYLRALFGEGFDSAATAMAWLAPAFLLNAAWLHLATGFSAYGETLPVLRYYGLYNAVLWALVLGLAPLAPLLGLPLAELFAAPLGFLLLRSMGNRHGIRIPARDVLEPAGLLAFALLAGTVAASAGGTPSRLGPAAAALALVIVCALRYRDLIHDLVDLFHRSRRA